MGILDYFREGADYGAALGEEQRRLQEQAIAAQSTPEADRRNKATLRVVPSAVARLPTSIIEGVQAVDQIVSSFGERSGSIPENLQRARYREGGFDKVQEFLANKQAEWQAANPDATSEQIKEFVSKYQNTPEYVAFERQQLPDRFGIPFYRKNEEVGDAIDNFMGVPTDNLKTNTENVLQNATQALIPVGIAKGLPKAARIAAEFLLPGNQATTTAGKLAVGGVAAGATAGIQAGLGRDVKPEEYTETLPKEPVPLAAVNFPELNTADGVEPPVTANATDKAEQIGAISGIIPGVQSLGIFAMLGAAAGIRPKIMPNIADTGPAYASRAGVNAPTVTETTKELAGTAYLKANQVLDERAPIQSAIAKAEGSYAKGVEGANEIGLHSPSAAGTSKRNHAEYGFLGDQQVTPLKNLDDMRTALRDYRKEDGTDGWDNVSKYLLARSELSNRGRYIDEVNANIQQKYIEHTAAVNAKDVAKANDVMQEIVKLQDDLKTRMDKRFQLQQHSTDELKEMIKNGPDVPGDNMQIGSRYVKAFDENNRAWMKQLEKDGLIEPEVIARINKHHDGSYAPMIEDELKGAKGISRVFAKATRQLQGDPDPSSQLGMRVNPFSQRDIREGAEGAEFLMDPHNALFKRSNQYHNWREAELFKRDAVERIMSGKNADAVIEEKLVGSGGRTAFSDAEVYAMSQKRDLSEFIPVKLTGNNGKTTFIKFREPMLTRALQAGPMDASIWRAMTSMLQRGATGAWNLGFAPMSTMLENAGIQIMRPRGSVGPIAGNIGKAVNAVAGEGAALKTINAIESVSHVLKPADLLVGQAEAVYGGAQLWWKQNRIRLADNMLTGLATDDGWFGAMMKMPAFRAWATKWAQNTVDTFQDTIEGALLDGKGMTFNTLAKNLEHTRELEKFMDVHVPPVARLVGSAVAEPFKQMKLAITSYRDAAKWMHYNRQVSFNALKYGGEDKIPEAVFKKMQNEVRTLTGDFTKRMGNSSLQMVDDTIPYFRVMIQSNKNFYQRMISDPKLAGAVIGGIVLPKIAFEYEMANWDKEAYDWYYRQNNAYERSGYVGFVRPDIMYRRHVLGEEIPFSPDHVYKLFSPQEARPITEAITQAIRGLGAYKAGQKDKVADTTMGSQFAQAISAAFAPGVPPPLAAILAQNGVRLDAGGMLRGENLVQSDSDKDRVNKLIATDSSITNSIHNTLGALMGGIGKSLAQGYATGEQVYKRTGKIEEAIWKGATEVKDRVMEGRAEPIPWLDLVNTRRYRQTPVTEELYKNRQAFQVISGSRTGGKAFTPTDPVLAYITDELRAASKTYEPKDFTTQYKELDTKLKAIEDNRSVPVPERQKQSGELLKQLHQLSIEQQKWMLKEEKSVGLREIQPGLTVADAYKKQFSEPFTLQNFAKRVKVLKNRQPQ